MVAGKTKRTPEERKKLHAALARRPGVTEKIAEATAEYKKAVAAGGLRRTPAPKRNPTGRSRPNSPGLSVPFKTPFSTSRPSSR
jgi:hypothetical protein